MNNYKVKDSDGECWDIMADCYLSNNDNTILDFLAGGNIVARFFKPICVTDNSWLEKTNSKK